MRTCRMSLIWTSLPCWKSPRPRKGVKEDISVQEFGTAVLCLLFIVVFDTAGAGT